MENKDASIEQHTHDLKAQLQEVADSLARVTSCLKEGAPKSDSVRHDIKRIVKEAADTLPGLLANVQYARHSGASLALEVEKRWKRVAQLEASLSTLRTSHADEVNPMLEDYGDSCNQEALMSVAHVCAGLGLEASDVADAKRLPVLKQWVASCISDEPFLDALGAYCTRLSTDFNAADSLFLKRIDNCVWKNAFSESSLPANTSILDRFRWCYFAIAAMIGCCGKSSTSDIKMLSRTDTPLHKMYQNFLQRYPETTTVECLMEGLRVRSQRSL